MNKILTIIVPSYNMEKYLGKCLDSLIVKREKGDVNNELMSTLEVLVINDGSKDRTSEIAHEYETKYYGVFRVIDKANGHYGSCVNRGLKETTGTYVRVLDADDYVDTVLFKNYLEVLKEESEKGEAAVDLLITNYKKVDPDGNVLEFSDYGYARDGYCDFPEFDDFKKRIHIHSITYKACLLSKVAYVQTEGQMYTDTEWILEPMVVVKSIRFMKSAVTCYLIGRDGQSVENEVLIKNFQQILNLAQNILEKYDQLINLANEKSIVYFRACVHDLVMWIYRAGILGYDGIKYPGDYDKFDEYVSRIPYFYNSTEQIKMPFGNLIMRQFPFYWIHEWRKSRKGICFMYYFHHWYLALRTKKL